MLHLGAAGISCPRPVANKQGSFVSMVELPGSADAGKGAGASAEDYKEPPQKKAKEGSNSAASHAVRLLTYLDGVVWDTVPQVCFILSRVFPSCWCSAPPTHYIIYSEGGWQTGKRHRHFCWEY